MQYRVMFSIFQMDDRVKTSAVGRALDCSAGGHGFDSRGRTNTQYLRITEKRSYSLCPANGQTFTWLGWLSKMTVPSPLWNVKIVSSISILVQNTLTLNQPPAKLLTVNYIFRCVAYLLIGQGQTESCYVILLSRYITRFFSLRSLLFLRRSLIIFLFFIFWEILEIISWRHFPWMETFIINQSMPCKFSVKADFHMIGATTSFP